MFVVLSPTAPGIPTEVQALVKQKFHVAALLCRQINGKPLFCPKSWTGPMNRLVAASRRYGHNYNYVKTPFLNARDCRASNSPLQDDALKPARLALALL